ncbi:hypothetical protein [Mesobacillus maritimus]|uniref:Peptidase n=1 Tax=Mesobacillus maritimus TaxID=1643336 RepID=A0ABS7K856_9BACI|nr:hypothetical protein [Mesobacillus maritimus]MBY0098270.1 hypothetical protein [Mesobacillus maritimus]
MVLGNRSKVNLHPLIIRKDKRHYIVEDIATNEFYEMPEVCIDAITMLNQDREIIEVENVLKERYPANDVDVKSFIQDLLEIGLVSKVDGVDIPRNEQKTVMQNGFAWIYPKLGGFFFNRYTIILYTCAFIGCIFLFIWKPHLFPTYKDVFLFELMTSNILVFLSLTFVLVLIHEMGHVLAVRAEDLPTRIGVGHRLFFVVLETDMSRVWSLPNEKRERLYLAGMYFDSFVLFFALLTQLVFENQAIVVGISKMIVINTFFRILYQCCVYMKTDLYYVLENRSGCYNLMENGQSYLRRWAPFLPAVKTSQVFDGEERLVRPYAIFYLVGILLTIIILVFYNTPLIIHAGILIMPGFTEPINSIQFWDATVFFLQFVIVFGLLGYSWLKKYKTV